MVTKHGVVKSLYLDEENRLLVDIVLPDGRLLRGIPLVGDKRPYPGSGVVVIDDAIALAPEREPVRFGNWILNEDVQVVAATCLTYFMATPWTVSLVAGPVVFSLNRKYQTTSLTTGRLFVRTQGLEVQEYEDQQNHRVFVIRGAFETEKGEKREFNWVILVRDKELVVKYCNPDQPESSNSTITLKPDRLELKVSGQGSASAVRITSGQVEINTPHLLVRADKADFQKGHTEGGEKCNRWQG